MDRDLIDAASKDLKCEEVDEGDAIYMVCKDREGKVVAKKRLLAVG